MEKFSFIHKMSIGLGLLLIFTILSRIPSLFEPYRYGDEGIYLTLGLALRKGLVWYRDIHDNKPPMLYLLAAVSGSQVWFRFILLWWHAANTVLIYSLAKNIFKKEIWALLAGYIFVIFNITQEGNIPNSEIFMVLPTTWAMLLLWKATSDRAKGRAERQQGMSNKKRYFFAGLLFGISFLFKVPAGFSFLAATLYLLFSEDLEIKLLATSIKKFVIHNEKFITLFLGFIIFPLLSVIYYWFYGACSQYLKAAFFQNLGYLSSWSGGHSEFIYRSFALLIISGLLFMVRKKISSGFLLVTLWFFLDLFGALLSGRPYPHYLIQVSPALSLLIIYFFISKIKLEKILVILSLLTLIFSYKHYKFWRYPVMPYYNNFFQFAAGRKNKNDYFSFFGNQVPVLYQLAEKIQILTRPEDKIFIWGNEPSLYALSCRLPAGRYTADYHIADFNGWEETIKAVRFNQPVLIVRFSSGGSFPELEEIIKIDYQLKASLKTAKIYFRTKEIFSE